MMHHAWHIAALGCWCGVVSMSASAWASDGGVASISVEASQALDAELAELAFFAEPEVQTQSATKIAQKLEEAPAVMTVLTRAQLRQWGYVTVAEALRHTLGFYVQDDFMFPNAAVRGISGGLWSESGLLKVMIDGRSTSFRSTAGNWLGPELIPISSVERIEIIRGPASALYGADAFLGVINIITRSGKSLDGADVSIAGVYVNSTPTPDSDVSVGFSEGRFDIVVGARHHSENIFGLRLPASSPRPVLPAYSLGRTRTDLVRSESYLGLLKGTYTGERTTVTATLYASGADRTGEFSPWLQLGRGLDDQGRFNDNHISLVRGFAGLKLQHVFTDTIDLTLDISYFAGGPTTLDRLEVGSDVYSVRRVFGYQGAELTAESKWSISSALTAIGGAGINYDEEKLPSVLHVLKVQTAEQRPGETVQSASTIQGSKPFINPGVYLQLFWQPPESWYSFIGGLRYDYHNIYGHQASGRLGAVAKVMKGLHVKLLYGNAFKAPSPFLLYAVPFRSGDVIGNSALKQQFVHTVEGEVSYRPHRIVSLTTNLSYSYLRDKAEFTPQGVNQVARNLAQVSALSWETGVEVAYEDLLKGYLRYEMNWNVRDNGQVGYQAELLGTTLDLYPPYQLHLGVQVQLGKVPLRVGSEGTLVGPRNASDSNTLENRSRYQLAPYFRLDVSLATVGLKLFGKRETGLMLTCRNLLDVQAADPGFSGVDYPIAPRTLMLQLRQEL